MTEQEWLECTDPTPMLTFLEEKVSDRKLRLLGCSCIRHLWTLFEEESPTAIMTSELFADGMTSKACFDAQDAKFKSVGESWNQTMRHCDHAGRHSGFLRWLLLKICTSQFSAN